MGSALLSRILRRASGGNYLAFPAAEGRYDVHRPQRSRSRLQPNNFITANSQERAFCGFGTRQWPASAILMGRCHILFQGPSQPKAGSHYFRGGLRTSLADGVRQLITNQEEIFNKTFFSTV